ncbi:MAG TPA: hypothetical protein VGM69_19260 [Chloroflexota bacterium]
MRLALVALLTAALLLPSVASATEPNRLPRFAGPAPEAIGASPEPAGLDELYWRPGPVPLEAFWRRMADLTHMRAFERVAPLSAEHRGDRLFGVNNALAAGDAAAPLMRGVGATWDRVELRWDEVEPEPGEYRFDQLDRLFENARRWDLAVVAVLVGAPRWAVDHPDRAGAGPPSDWPAWERFVSVVADRYRDQVAAWEVWNEPNIPEFWRGSTADYARLLRTAYPALKRAAPSSTVLVGGLVQDDGAWLRRLLSEEPPFDAVAWHVYNDPREVTRLAALTKQLGVATPIWVTEANVPLRDPDRGFGMLAGTDAVTPGEQAAFVLQLFALSRAAGVETAMVYRATDVGGHHWGLVREDMTIRPSFLAYRTAARWLSGTRFVAAREPVPGVTEVELARPGERVRVLWSDLTRETEVALPADGGLLVYSSGASVPLRSGRVAVPAAQPAGPYAVRLGEPVIAVVPEGS